jgi:hypothetical protein
VEDPNPVPSMPSLDLRLVRVNQARGCVFEFGVLLSMCRGQSARHPRTVRKEPIDRVFVVLFTCFCVPFIRSILLEDFLCTKFMDGPYYSVGRFVMGRTVCGLIVDNPLLRL